MKTFYYAKPIANGLAMLLLCVAGASSVIAPCMDSKDALELVNSLNNKLVACEEMLHNVVM